MSKWKDPNYKRYYEQTKKVESRNIEWQFTFETWLDWWGDDLHLRGNRKDDLCMCRYQDSGPYHPDNCYKDTMANNSRDKFKHKPMSAEHRAKIKTRLSEVRSKPIKTDQGVFKSIQVAADSLGVHRATIKNRIKAGKYSYI